MTDEQNKTQPNKTQKDPLHGVKLETMLNYLVDNIGWAAMAQEVKINCFRSDPSVKSSLKFLRRTPWARDKVEAMYIEQVTGQKVTRAPLEFRQANNHKPLSKSVSKPVANPWAKHQRDDD